MSAVGVTIPPRIAIDTPVVREEVEEKEEEKDEEEKDGEEKDEEEKDEEGPAVDTAGPPLLTGDMAWRNGHKNLLALEEGVSESEYKWAMVKTCGDTLKGIACETKAHCVRVHGQLFACKDVKPGKVCYHHYSKQTVLTDLVLCSAVQAHRHVVHVRRQSSRPSHTLLHTSAHRPNLPLCSQ